MNHPPLFQPGITTIQEADFDTIFTSPFTTSTTRPRLVQGLRDYIHALRITGINFELWIDGSFTTQKENPNDVDLVAFAAEQTLNSVSKNVQIYLQSVLNDRFGVKNRFNCDVLFSLAEDENMRSYWRGWYGFDREENPKGIARIEINQ